MKTVAFRGHLFNYNTDEGFWEGLARETDKWEPEMFDILDKYLGKDKTLLDIGAWNGICSLYAAKLGATAFAIEPDKDAFYNLRENIDINDSRRVYTNKFAIADYDGGTLLYNHEKFGNSMSSIVRRDGECHTVQCFTLMNFDTMYGAKFDLIKMDIEGAELLVIPASMEYFKKNVCPLYLSVHPYYYPDADKDTEMLMNTLSEIFTIDIVAKDSWLCVPKQ